VIAAETDAEAVVWRPPANVVCEYFRGARGLSQPPIDDIEPMVANGEGAGKTDARHARSLVQRMTVRSGLQALIAETSADELMIVSDVYAHSARLRSFE